MFEYLFTIFDIPLACIFIILSLSSIILIKNVYNVFLALFTSIFLIIFIASTILTQQVYLGEFLVVSIFFILAIVFFIFNLNEDYDKSISFEKKSSKLKIIKTIFSILIFVLLFSIIGLNFQRINISKNNFITKNLNLKDELSVFNGKDDKVYDSYVENISLLNQNKIFQKLTHIVMLYVCLVVVLYFFNRKSDSDLEKENNPDNKSLIDDDLESEDEEEVSSK